jgi:hypothetical protein
MRAKVAEEEKARRVRRRYGKAKLHALKLARNQMALGDE